MKDAIQQFSHLWSQLGLNQRVSIALSGVGVLAGMVALLAWSGRPRMQLLYGGVGAGEMADVIKALDEAEIPHEVRGRGSVFVPTEHVHKARLDLAGRGLPSGGEVGLEIFDSNSIGVSRFVQQTNLRRAIQGELAKTLSMMRGVRGARVMITMPENRNLLDASAEKRVPTASVFLNTGGSSLPDEAVTAVQFLVANAVEGLGPNGVAVTDNNGKVLSEIRLDDSFGAANEHLKHLQFLEAYYSRKVESILAHTVGVGNVVARVSAKLRTESRTRVEESYNPDLQVVRSQTVNEDSTTTTESGGGLPPVGAGSNLPAGQRPAAAAGSPSNTTEEKSNVKTVEYDNPLLKTETVEAPGGIERLAAGVLIALRYTGEGEEKTEDPRTPEQLADLRSLIYNTLGIDPADDPENELVTVVEVPFDEGPPVAEAGVGQLGETVLRWVDAGRDLIGAGVAVVMFLLFLRMVKRHSVEIVGVEVLEERAALEAAPVAVEPQAQLTPEVLNGLIQEKPENVSTALKNWVSNSPKK